MPGRKRRSVRSNSGSFSYTAVQKRALALIGSGAHNIMLFGGSRSGKTFTLCAATAVRALKAPGSRHAVVRRYFAGVRSSVGMDTMPKMLSLRFPELAWKYNKSDGCFIFPNGSEIWLLGLDDAERSEKILGKEFATIYFNECSEISYDSVQTALTRLAQKVDKLENKAFYDCNPPSKSHWTYQLFIEKYNPADKVALARPDDYAAMQINPMDNRENLPSNYIENTLKTLPEKQKRRFLEGKFSDDDYEALWKQNMLERNRVKAAPELERIVIGVDPAVTLSNSSDCTGIIAAGRACDGKCYILEDASCRATPAQWAKKAVSMYRKYQADRIIGEVNNGGDLIETVLRSEAPDVSFRAVRATRGKILRAEPVAALYERNMVSHVGVFRELEEQMVNYTGRPGLSSPDRLDALVWAVTSLMENEPRFILA